MVLKVEVSVSRGVNSGVNSDEENIDRVLDREEKGTTFWNDSGEGSTDHGEEGTDL